MANFGENGIVLYSDDKKNLYILVIDNISGQQGTVYFKTQPAYRVYFDGKNYIFPKISSAPAKGFRISKLPGFVNRPKKETGQMEIPGFEAKKKNPKGGYPALFNYMKNLTNISQLKGGDLFDSFVYKNKEKYNLTPPEKFLKEEIKKIFKKFL